MLGAMFIVTAVTATFVAVGAVIAAVVMVSVASRREDADWSLGGPAADPMRLAARRVLGYHSEVIEPTLPKSRVPAVPHGRPLEKADADDVGWRAARTGHPVGSGRSRARTVSPAGSVSQCEHPQSGRLPLSGMQI